MQKTIEFNEQEIDFLKLQLEEISTNYNYTYSQTAQKIAHQIINKLNEE